MYPKTITKLIHFIIFPFTVKMAAQGWPAFPAGVIELGLDMMALKLPV
jgi:hypothetical protein